MNELIYKRDVLHAIYKEWQGCSNKYGAYDIIYDTTDAIDKIKPAENVREIVFCKNCKHRSEHSCPMYYEEWFEIDEGDGYIDNDYIIHDNTKDDGFCDCGERKDND